MMRIPLDAGQQSQEKGWPFPRKRFEPPGHTANPVRNSAISTRLEASERLRLARIARFGRPDDRLRELPEPLLKVRGPATFLAVIDVRRAVRQEHHGAALQRALDLLGHFFTPEGSGLATGFAGGVHCCATES